MKKRIWWAIVPVGLLAPLVMGMHKSQPAAIYATNHAQMEKTVGYHLFAPTDLPRGLKPGSGGMRQGAVRVLCDYSNGEDLLIVAQEPRSPKRDVYNHAQFAGSAVDVNGMPGTMTRGTLGERRLAYFTDDATVVLSSTSLSDQELLRVAKSMK